MNYLTNSKNKQSDIRMNNFSKILLVEDYKI